jgi:hypothetical protein
MLNHGVVDKNIKYWDTLRANPPACIRYKLSGILNFSPPSKNFVLYTALPPLTPLFRKGLLMHFAALKLR